MTQTNEIMFDFSKIFLHIDHSDGAIAVYSTDREWLMNLKSCDYFNIRSTIISDIDGNMVYPQIFNIAILTDCSEDFITILKLHD